MTNPGRGRGIQVSHKPTQTRTLNEYYRLARLARSIAWQRFVARQTNTAEETQP